MSGGLFVSDGKDLGTDHARLRNLDYQDFQYDPKGVFIKSKQEYARACRAIEHAIVERKPKPGERILVPVESKDGGGSYSYGVRITGDLITDFVIIERLRIR